MKSVKEQKTKRAVVVSKSGDKSIKVEMNYKIKHPVYNKFVKRRTKLGVHDEGNAAGLGDAGIGKGGCRVKDLYVDSTGNDADYSR